MPEELKATIDEWRDKGVMISDEAAESVYKLCLRKMKISKVEDPDNYIFLLYPDEVKNFLFREAVNARTFLMMMEKEGCEYGKQGRCVKDCRQKDRCLIR